METAVGTRRSLLHDVLSQAELSELGLDSSVDDLPPLVTRLFHSSANVVYCFSWITFFGFWLSSVTVLYHVAITSPDRLLPSTVHYAFLTAYSGLLLCGELTLYYYIKHSNAVVTGRSAEVRHFALTSRSLISHAVLSLVVHMCAFLDLLFVLHSYSLPKPMLVCASFTVMLNTGFIPFMFQLRSLTSYYRRDKFDPLECGSYIPASSLGSFFGRCFLLAVRGVAATIRSFCKVIARTRRFLLRATSYFAHSVRSAGYRFSRGSVRTSPARRVMPDCCGPSEIAVVMDDFPDDAQGPGNGRGESDLGRSSSSTSRLFQRTIWPGGSQHDNYDSHKDALLTPSGTTSDTALEKAPRGLVDAACSQMTRLPRESDHLDAEFTEHVSLEAQNIGANETAFAETWEGPGYTQPLRCRELPNVVDSGTSVTLTAAGTAERNVHPESSRRSTSIFVAPRASLTLTTCLMLLDLQVLCLYFREVSTWCTERCGSFSIVRKDEEHRRRDV